MKRSPAMSGGVKRSVPSRSPASTTPDDFSDSSKRFRADSNQGASSGASLGGRSGCGKAGCGLLGGGARSAREGRTYGGRGGCVVCDMRGGTSWMALVRILLVGVRQHAMHHILSAGRPKCTHNLTYHYLPPPAPGPRPHHPADALPPGGSSYSFAEDNDQVRTSPVPPRSFR